VISQLKRPRFASVLDAASRSLLLLAAFALAGPPRAAAQSTAAGNAAPAQAVSSDPVLRAMSEELDRSKARLKMDNLPAPYYIEYHVYDVEQFDAEAAFGALRVNQRTQARGLRVIVRVGDYKQDSYYGPGTGVSDIAPIDNDIVALRRALWLATDRAYKAASQALSSKQAALSQFSADQPFDDFAHAPVLQIIEPLAKLQFDAKPWTETLVKASALYAADPKIDYLSAQIRFRVVNRYFLNTEGTVTRQGSEVDSLDIAASTQAADGMELERTPSFVAARLADLPTPEKIQAETAATLVTLKALREAPLVEEDYRGPVLLAPDAADDVIQGLIGQNLRGIRPKPGESARTAGNFSSSYKTRVLPNFLSVTDDPTLRVFAGQSLVGSYDVDDEGVAASKVSLIDNGQLVSYLLGRQPIRDFPISNGHGRAGPGQSASPNLGTLMLQSSEPVSADDLKKKLIDLCREENRPYGYFVATLYGGNPRLLYRVYVQDGHEELVRGGVFNDLDTRSLRSDIVAAGNDPLVRNLAASVPTTVIGPSLLFDELEVRRTDEKNAKLPEYGPPSPAASQ
jgi:TldD protein